jgi:hypothetical protein
VPLCLRVGLLIRRARSRLRRFRVHERYDVRPILDGLRQASGHCGREGERLVSADPVVPNGVDRDHTRVVLD